MIIIFLINTALLTLYNKAKNLELKATIYIIEYLVFILKFIFKLLLFVVP